VAAGSPAGTVTLLAGQEVVGTATPVNGVVSFPAARLGVGVLPLTVSYSGDATRAASQLQFTQTIVASPSAATVTFAATPSRTPQGLAVLLSASVQGNAPGGSVSFYNGATLLGTAPLAYGMASLTLAGLPAGLTQLRAQYSGDTKNAAAASATQPHMPALPVPMGTKIVAPRPVWSMFGRPGGGTELRSYSPVTQDMWKLSIPPRWIE
jgi:Bacterial Ig-like domain (group 3)